MSSIERTPELLISRRQALGKAANIVTIVGSVGLGLTGLEMLLFADNKPICGKDTIGQPCTNLNIRKSNSIIIAATFVTSLGIVGSGMAARERLSEPVNQASK